MVDTKRYFILSSELFCNVKEKAPQDENLNEMLEKVFRNIESSARGHDSEEDLKGLFDDLDVNSNKLGGILAAYEERKDKAYYAAVVANDRIAENDYNLSVSSYVEQEDTREKIDIKVLNAEIEQIVAREQTLRDEIAKIIADIEVDV